MEFNENFDVEKGDQKRAAHSASKNQACSEPVDSSRENTEAFMGRLQESSSEKSTKISLAQEEHGRLIKRAAAPTYDGTEAATTAKGMSHSVSRFCQHEFQPESISRKHGESLDDLPTPDEEEFAAEKEKGRRFSSKNGGKQVDSEQRKEMAISKKIPAMPGQKLKHAFGYMNRVDSGVNGRGKRSGSKRAAAQEEILSVRLPSIAQTQLARDKSDAASASLDSMLSEQALGGDNLSRAEPTSQPGAFFGNRARGK